MGPPTTSSKGSKSKTQGKTAAEIAAEDAEKLSKVKADIASRRSHVVANVREMLDALGPTKDAEIGLWYALHGASPIRLCQIGRVPWRGISQHSISKGSQEELPSAGSRYFQGRGGS